MMFALFSLCGMAVAQDVAPVESDTKVVIEFLSETPKLVIGVVDSRATGQVAGYSTSAVFTRDLCIAPCSVELEPGLYEFYAKGGGKYVRAEQFQLTQASTTLVANPGISILNSAGRYMIYGGVLSVLGGGLVYATAGSGPTLEEVEATPGLESSSYLRDQSVILMGAGAGSAAVGLPLMLMTKGTWTLK